MNALESNPSVLKKAKKSIADYFAYPTVISILFCAISISLIIAPQTGSFGWVLKTYSTPASVLSFLFSACAVIIAFRPHKNIFIISMLPLALYGLVTIVYLSYNTNLSYGTIWYVFGTILMTKTIYGRSRCRNKNIRFLQGLIAVLIATSVLDNPETGTAFWMFTNYGIDGRILALVLMLTNLALVYCPTTSMALVALSTYGLYLFSSLVYTLTDLNRIGLAAIPVTLIAVANLLYLILNIDTFYSGAKNGDR